MTIWNHAKNCACAACVAAAVVVPTVEATVPYCAKAICSWHHVDLPHAPHPNHAPGPAYQIAAAIASTATATAPSEFGAGALKVTIS